MRRIVLIAALALSAAASPAAAGGRWTWTLYENPNSLALANEVPDSDSLAAVLECRPGSGRVKVSLFPNRDGLKPVAAEYAATDAAFAAFVRTGKLELQNDIGAGEIAMKRREHRDKLRRFATMCGA